MYLFSGQGILTILVIALILFGPDKLPQLGKTIGRFMAEFKRAQESVEQTIRAEMYQSEAKPVTPAAAPAFTPSSSDEDEEDEE